MKTLSGSPSLRLAIHRREAFSLIEVLLAIGIMAFAVIPLMGLLPVGLSSYRSASDSMIQTAIARYVVSLMASKTPATWQTSDLYFSDQMTPLTNSSNAAYRIVFISPTQENIPSDSGTTQLDRLWRISYEVWDARSTRKIGNGGFDLVDRK